MTLRQPLLLVSAILAVTLPLAAQQPIKITADLTESGRKLYHAEVDLPAHAGENSYTTPKWIPGNHRPTGPADEITGVVFTANGKTLTWRRDDVDLYEFHVQVPQGASTIHAHLDCIVLARASDKIAVLEWEKLLLYPAHKPVKEIPVQPSVTVPAGWGVGTALTPVTPYDPNTKPGGTIQFQPTTVEQLEDSPVITGEYFHEFPLAPDVKPLHYIDVVSDEPADSNLRPALLAELSNLVYETGAAYASRHYNVYHFLLTLSDITGGEGLEHGQSSDNGVGELGFARQGGSADLLAHEFTHSWNGKYRRPDKLYQDDFAKAQVGELLWVYEGMTQYMGNVLAARSGLESQQQYRDRLASSAATLDYKSGRAWRSTDDTALAASILRGGNPAWSNWKRGQDYYQEGELLWLDADTLIRKLTNGQKTLTDFQHIFLGKGGNTGPLIVPYSREQLIRDLNEVVKYDWAGFLHDRVDAVTPHADLAGIEQGGYKLVFQDQPSGTDRAQPAAAGRGAGGPNVWYSLGLRVGGAQAAGEAPAPGSPQNTLSDVRWGSPADKAKLAPGEKLVAVNGRTYTADRLLAAVREAKSATEPIHLIVQSQDYLRTVNLDYHEGERYPVLQRMEGAPAVLDEITKPLSPQTVIPTETNAGSGGGQGGPGPAGGRRRTPQS